jgi:hypothetical protein
MSISLNSDFCFKSRPVIGIFVSRAATGNCPEITTSPLQKEAVGGSARTTATAQESKSDGLYGTRRFVVERYFKRGPGPRRS